MRMGNNRGENDCAMRRSTCSDEMFEAIFSLANFKKSIK